MSASISFGQFNQQLVSKKALSRHSYSQPLRTATQKDSIHFGNKGNTFQPSKRNFIKAMGVGLLGIFSGCETPWGGINGDIFVLDGSPPPDPDTPLGNSTFQYLPIKTTNKYGSRQSWQKLMITLYRLREEEAPSEPDDLKISINELKEMESTIDDWIGDKQQDPNFIGFHRGFTVSAIQFAKKFLEAYKNSLNSLPGPDVINDDTKVTLGALKVIAEANSEGLSGYLIENGIVSGDKVTDFGDLNLEIDQQASNDPRVTSIPDFTKKALGVTVSSEKLPLYIRKLAELQPDLFAGNPNAPEFDTFTVGDIKLLNDNLRVVLDDYANRFDGQVNLGIDAALLAKTLNFLVTNFDRANFSDSKELTVNAFKNASETEELQLPLDFYTTSSNTINYTTNELLTRDEFENL